MLYAVFLISVVVILLLVAGLWFLRRRPGPNESATPHDPPPRVEAAPEQQHLAQRQSQLATIAQEKGWTAAAYNHVLDGQIAPGMTQDMILLAWGGPTQIDHRTTNQKGVPVERWVYQMPATHAQQYVWFASGRVVRVEEK